MEDPEPKPECDSLPSTGNESAHGAGEPRRLETDALSTFRTRHVFHHYAEFRTPEEFVRLRRWARDRGLPICVVGRGSNLLFCRRHIRTLVLLNQMPKEFTALGEDRFYASSNLSIGAVLRTCRAESRDSFYYLASVPASVGGALAMNAGRGESFHQTLYDFVSSVTFIAGDEPEVITREKMVLRHRWTPFRDQPETLILGATFRFPVVSLQGNPIAERLAYCKEVQDPTAPNCGSAFSHCAPDIMRRLMGRRILGAQWSPKTQNWILNRSESSLGVRLLLKWARLLHAIRRRRCAVEYIQVR